MKFVLSAIFLLAAAAASWAQPGEDHRKWKDTTEVPRVTLEDAKKAFDEGSAIFIDARPSEAYKDGHVKGSINLPYGSTDDFDKLPRGKTIIVYCS
jgi:3-mercaptopyruvate sulfurtransferase SseA